MAQLLATPCARFRRFNVAVYQAASLLIACGSVSPAASAQAAPQAASAAPERQMDFWLGDWDIDAEGRSGPGPNGKWIRHMRQTNHVTSIMNGKVIEEEFDGLKSGYQGLSVSVYAPSDKLWRQTWVDSGGGYLRFQGGMTDDGKHFVLETALPRGGKVVPFRMVYTNISPNSFDWYWQSSPDDGKTWTNIKIDHYKRRSAKAAPLSPDFSAKSYRPLPPAQAAADPKHQLDFWIGDWTMASCQRTVPTGETWTDGTCANHVHPILGGAVIQEQFDGSALGAPAYYGMSLSVFEPITHRWYQTWVDNQGSYLALSGDHPGDTMTFSRDIPLPNGGTRIMRMVFSDIAPASFTWTWQGSTDAGKTWRDQWILKYSRDK